jgi:hypothetical protein
VEKDSGPPLLRGEPDSESTLKTAFWHPRAAPPSGLMKEPAAACAATWSNRLQLRRKYHDLVLFDSTPR